MRLNLTTTWNPRGELSRFLRLYNIIENKYDNIFIILPDTTDNKTIKSIKISSKVHVHKIKRWERGRYYALEKSLKFFSDYNHYFDMDRLLRWIETNKDEYLKVIETDYKTDCLIIGRSKKALSTHPLSLLHNERITNMFFSYVFKQNMDISSGAKIFSRRAIKMIVNNTSSKTNIFGTDSAWIALLVVKDYKIKAISVDGLDWESADRYLNYAATKATQREKAVKYDKDPFNWEKRTEITNEIIKAGLNIFAGREKIV